MNPDLDTLATRLYVTIDDLLVEHPEWAPERPKPGIAPKLSDAELVTLAVLQALLGFTSEARFNPPRPRPPPSLVPVSAQQARLQQAAPPLRRSAPAPHRAPRPSVPVVA